MPMQETLFRRLYNLPYGYTNSFHLFDSAKNSKDLLQRLRLQTKIPAHNGCVNSICWNENGKYLLSGSDDRHLCVTDGYDYSVLTYIPTGHRSNIFSAKFLPGGDNRVVSCSGDGVIIYTDFESEESSMSNQFNCHFGTAYEVMTVPSDPNTFLSCGEDGTVRWFDLRTKTHCSKESCKEDVLIDCHSGVSALGLNPACPYQLAVGCADATVRIYDRRMLCTSATGGMRSRSGMKALMANFTVPEFTSNHRITSLKYSQDGQEMLVSYSSDFIYLFDVKCSFNKEPKVLNSAGKNTSKNDKSKSHSRPLMKRLRVRGDWSDTGPNARPESEAQGEQRSRTLHASLMQRMSDVLTSMYNQRSQGQQGTVSSSSSHSEDSEVEEADENNAEERSSEPEPPPSDSNPDTSSASETPQFHVPTLNQSEGVGKTIAEEENMVQEEQPPSDAVREQTSSSSSPPSSHFADISIKVSAIRVSPSSSTVDDHISCTKSQSTSQAASSSEVLNQSVQNIKQEISMSKKTSNEKQDNEQSVIVSNSSSQDSSACVQNSSVKSVNDDDVFRDASSADDGAASACDGTTNLNNESPKTICDNQQPMDFTPAAAETNEDDCDGRNVPSCSNEPVVKTPSASADHSNDSVPDIFVAALPTSTSEEGAASSRDEQRPNRVEGQMTFMMEMDSWDVDSEEEPVPSASRLDLEVPSEIASLEDYAIAEDLEEEEQEHVNRISHPQVTNKYMGHRNARTMIKEATFWGDNFIMSGSDCGHIFVWDRFTAELVMLMEADHHVVNCLQPHPFDPILASSGIDYDIKIWSPLHDEPFFDEEKATEIIKRNRVMLEETKDTITVPASFMIRMLASLNHITSGRGWRRMAQHLRDGARRYR